MWNVYLHVFYILYSWARKLGTDSTPQYTAIVTMSVFMLINIFSLIDFVMFRFSIDSKLLDEPTFFVILTVYLVILAFHYILLIANGKLNEIVLAFRDKITVKGYKEALIVILYIAVTISLAIYSSRLDVAMRESV